MTSRSLSRNIGEWSELYALSYLLAHGGGYGADANINPKEDLFYEVSHIGFPNEVNGADIIYQVEGKDVVIYVDHKVVDRIGRTQLSELSSGLHSALKVEHKGRSFRLSEGDRLLKLLKKESTSASSGSSNDIFLKINHSRVNLPDSLVGFSIKSQLGSAATFLNASLATNFVYEIVPVAALPKRSIPKFSENIKESIQNLIACGYSLKFTNLDNDIFKRNLELIDKNLPQQLAKCLAETMNHSKNHVSQIVETVFPLNSKENEVIQSNIKLFLSHVLQGMRPAREWSKLSSTSGGIIHVKSSGEVLIHVSDQLDDLRNYLFNKLKFERGDRGRHKYGTPFKVGNKTFIKLNLQLRFI